MDLSARAGKAKKNGGGQEVAVIFLHIHTAFHVLQGCGVSKTQRRNVVGHSKMCSVEDCASGTEQHLGVSIFVSVWCIAEGNTLGLTLKVFRARYV